MTKIEENIGKAIGALMLVGIGWLGTLLIENNKMTIQSQVSIAQTRVIALETQKDVTAMRKELTLSRDKIAEMDKRLSNAELAIVYMKKEKEE